MLNGRPDLVGFSIWRVLKAEVVHNWEIGVEAYIFQVPDHCETSFDCTPCSILPI